MLENLTAVDLVNLGKALTQLNSQTSAVTVKRDSDVEMLDESPIKIEPGTEDDRFVVPSWITSTSAARLFKVAALEQFVTESIRKANSEINNNEKLKVKKSMKIAAITNNSPVEETPAANLHDIKRENVEDSSPKSSSFQSLQQPIHRYFVDMVMNQLGVYCFLQDMFLKRPICFPKTLKFQKRKKRLCLKHWSIHLAVLEVQVQELRHQHPMLQIPRLFKVHEVLQICR